MNITYDKLWKKIYFIDSLICVNFHFSLYLSDDRGDLFWFGLAPLLLTELLGVYCSCCWISCWCCFSARIEDFRSGVARSLYVSETCRGTRLSWGSLEQVWNEFSECTDRREPVSGSTLPPRLEIGRSGGREESLGRFLESSDSKHSTSILGTFSIWNTIPCNGRETNIEGLGEGTKSRPISVKRN